MLEYKKNTNTRLPSKSKACQNMDHLEWKSGGRNSRPLHALDLSIKSRPKLAILATTLNQVYLFDYLDKVSTGALHADST